MGPGQTPWLISGFIPDFLVELTRMTDVGICAGRKDFLRTRRQTSETSGLNPFSPFDFSRFFCEFHVFLTCPK
jgi:hypothetical protein